MTMEGGPALASPTPSPPSESSLPSSTSTAQTLTHFSSIALSSSTSSVSSSTSTSSVSSARVPPASSPSTSPSISPSRPLKRRLLSASDLNFFVPAADSFKPLPYTPHHSAINARDARPERVQARPVTAHNLTTVGLDPLPTDPDATFLRWPFSSFPNKDRYPEINYNVLADNPNWFLHPDDYIPEKSKGTPTTTNPNAVHYPAVLEPPRGWCPTKKKDLKENGDVWPDGETPRLRCTFCRRTYAGVNAKSMWRRHVYEKHKIAMASRRNDAERPRGRTINKEPKRNGKAPRHDTIVDLDVDTNPVETVVPPTENVPIPPEPSCSSPAPGRTVPPASPYDPLLTPAFRHSPPRLPSDQPWRFTSPSHPLHSSRHYSLTMLREESPAPSPLIKRVAITANASSPFSSPCSSKLFGTPDSPSRGRAFLRGILGRSITAPMLNTPMSVVQRRLRAPVSLLGDSNLLEGEQNPFVAWGNSENHPPSSSPEGESPVVRSKRSAGTGLGIGLLEPFILPALTDSCQDLDFDELMQLDEETQVVDSLKHTNAEVPPLKKRRTTS
ncbi:unnamed protein product [Mycena citricolor]|uniref:Uncharacterized protein n=1 Tax=Mycena citricolor TaxID=2018698 RepID=A0AAD2HR19_9AGAR|nr:unnamed protein product [Mycena citricolor]